MHLVPLQVMLILRSTVTTVASRTAVANATYASSASAATKTFSSADGQAAATTTTVV